MAEADSSPASGKRPFTVARLGAGGPAVAPGLRGSFAVLGNLDGVHLGHQGLIALARQRAGAIGAPAIAVTFEPHPRALLQPAEPLFRLTPEAEKLRLLEAAGLGGAAIIAFDRQLADLEAEPFFFAVLAGSVSVRGLIVGEDFRFGRGRRGDLVLLSALGREAGIEVHGVSPIGNAAGEPYSSGRVRTALSRGDVAAANAMLGYRWFVAGTVVAGDRRGRMLGYPTANLRVLAGFGLRHGIYAVTVTRPGGPPLGAVASFGRRPTFDNGAPLLEVHVFDFAGDLYGETIIITFHAWIRPELRFDSLAALIRQMDEDSVAARRLLANAAPATALDRALAEVSGPGRLVAGAVPIA